MDQKKIFLTIGSVVLLILIGAILYFLFTLTLPVKKTEEKPVQPTFNQEDILKSLTTQPEQKITPQIIQQNEKSIEQSINTPPKPSSAAPTKSPSSQELTPTEQEILKSINTPPSQ